MDTEELLEMWGYRIRKFVPSRVSNYRSVPPGDLVVYNPEKKISQLQEHISILPMRRDDRTMVVYIDGACRSNGTPSAKSSYGIYFGEGSPYNSASLIESSIPQTSTRAEIEALKHALDIIEDITDKDLRLQRIKIATDSSYLVDAMSTHIYKWIENGGKGSRGKIRHFDRLKEIHGKLDYMEYGDEGGREAEFWLIPREMNREADGLANAVLDQMEACSTSH